MSSGGEKRLGRPRGRDSGPSFPCRPFEVGNSAGESFRVTIRSLGKWVIIGQTTSVEPESSCGKSNRFAGLGDLAPRQRSNSGARIHER